MSFKKLLLSLFIVIFLFSGCRQKHQKNTKEFEGIITYRITRGGIYHVKAPSADTMKIYYSHGNMIKLMNGKIGVKEEFFLKDKGYYFTDHRSNSLFTSDPTNSGGFILMSVSDARPFHAVLKYPCKVINVSHGYVSKHSYMLYDTYGYSGQAFPIDPEFFKKDRYGDFSRFTDESGAYYLYHRLSIVRPIEGETNYITEEAIDIKPQKIDPKMFDIDTKNAIVYKP